MAIEIMQDTGFHSLTVTKDYATWLTLGEWKTKFTYTFYNHFHPFVGELLEQLNKKSIDGLLDADFHESLEQDFFKGLYRPNESDKTVAVGYSPKEIDVSEHGTYAVYNWELLFHVPLTIAVHLSKNQRFAEAQRWFHYIFDPTTNDQSIEPPKRFWKFLAFRQDKNPTQIDELLRRLSDTATDSTVRQDILKGYQAILN